MASIGIGYYAISKWCTMKYYSKIQVDKNTVANKPRYDRKKKNIGQIRIWPPKNCGR